MGKNFYNIISLLTILFISTTSCSEKSTDPPGIDPPNISTIDYNPSWSPDGNIIAFERQDNSDYGIFLIDTNATNLRQLVNFFAGSPSWSPDGEWLAFSDGNIYKIKSNGDSLTQLTFEGNNFFPTWAPDGEWLAYDSNNDSPNGMYFIWKMKKDGGNKQRLAYTPTLGETRMPNWANDNKIIHIRYVADGSGLPEIFRMNSTGGDVTRITTNTLFELFPSASPGSDLVMFTSSLEQVKIYTVDYGGSNYIPLTNELSYSSDWSPDGEKIVYCNATPNNGRLWIMGKDGSDKKQLTF